MSEASSHTHKSTRPFSIISCDDANTQQTHNKHMHTHTHTSFFCAERICDSPKSPGSALVAQSIASRITGFRHVTTSLSWDRSKRRPARSYGLQLDERASTMVLGSAGGPPRSIAVLHCSTGNLKATKRILPQPLVARHVQTLRRSAAMPRTLETAQNKSINTFTKT